MIPSFKPALDEREFNGTRILVTGDTKGAGKANAIMATTKSPLAHVLVISCGVLPLER